MSLPDAQGLEAPRSKPSSSAAGPRGADASGTGIIPAKPSRLTRAKVFLFALASGLAVANVYFAHPLLDVIADDLGLSHTAAGVIVGATQLGYGLGLVLLVPLGDLVDRRKLIIAHPCRHKQGYRRECG